jgi:uncharacterized membrane protein
MTTVLERIDRIEVDVRRLQRELEAVRAEVGVATPPATSPAPTAKPVTPPRPQPVRPAAPPPPEPRPSFWERYDLPRMDWSDLLGARGLALAGGVVTLLGVVFFFALAASNGWIGPVARVILGAAASTGLFAAGVLVHARFGRLHAAVAAAGAGIAGGYATLLFAAARYELVPPLGALVCAAGIAAIGVALALAWRSEIVAGLGLIGAMCVPAVALIDDTATATGTAFVALVLFASAVVALRQRWDLLLVAAGAVSVPQLLVLVLEEGEPARARVIVLAAVFGLLYLGIGVARQLLAGGPRLDSLAGTFAGGNVALTLASSFVLLDGDARAIALAAAAAVYAGLAVWLWKDATRELGALAAAAGSALAAVALAQALDGPALVVAWAAETVALAWLGRRIADARFQLLALGYLALALVYALVEEAPLHVLFDRDGDYLAGVPALLAVAAGSLAFGLLAREWPATRGTSAMARFLAQLVEAAQRRRRELRVIAFCLGAVLLFNAAALAVLDATERLGIEPAFDWGHVAVTGLAALAALVALAIGVLRPMRSFEVAGLVWLGATLVEFQAFTHEELLDHRGWAALVLAVGLPAAALLHWLAPGRTPLIAVGAVGLGAFLSGYAAVALLDGDAVGYALLASAAAHALVAALVFRARDLATSFWTAATALALFASTILLDGNWLVLAWAAGSSVLALLGTRVREPRLWLAAAALVVLAATLTLGVLAHPLEFLSANDEPASGVPAVLFTAAALVVLGLAIRRVERPADELDAWIDESVGVIRTAARWSAPLFGLYACSLAILELAQLVGDASLTTEFQRGHTGVSALWGAVALVALVVGLRRGSRALRLGGLGLFGIALVKLFVYDLSTLSSITRAASFLAVGGVLLLAGFFYQRLAAEPAA